MTRTLRTALAAGICAAVAVTTAAAPPAAGQAAAQGREKTNFGFKGTAVGVKLFVNNVQALTTKDAVAPLRCTRMAGRNVRQVSTLSTPDNPLVKLSSSTSETTSYRDGKRHGVLATNSLGDITLGDLPTGLPQVTIKGLTTTADAFHDGQGYGHQETIDYEQLTIELPAETEVPEPLQDLLDAIEAGVDQVIDVLEEAVTPIEIPGLGSIALGRTKGVSKKHFAESDAAAFEFEINAVPDEVQKLQLGHTRARIGGPTPGGVFRSTSMPMDIKALDGGVHLGGVKPRTIPCEGTRDRVRTKTLAAASAVVPSGALIGVDGVEYTFRGTQHRDGTADGFDANHIDQATMLAGQFVINDINARTNVKTRSPNGKVRKSFRTSIGSISYFGEELPVPKPGGTTPLPNGEGYIERQIVKTNKWGGRVIAVRVSLLEENVVIDFGIAASQIFKY